MKRLRNTMLAIPAILLSVLGTAQAEGVNVKFNRSADNLVHSLDMGPAGQIVLNVPKCAEFTMEMTPGENGRVITSYTTCGRNYVMDFHHGALIDFRVEEIGRR